MKTDNDNQEDNQEDNQDRGEALSLQGGGMEAKLHACPTNMNLLLQ